MANLQQIKKQIEKFRFRIFGISAFLDFRSIILLGLFLFAIGGALGAMNQSLLDFEDFRPRGEVNASIFIAKGSKSKTSPKEQSIYIDDQLMEYNRLEALAAKSIKDTNTLHYFSHGRPGELLIEGNWKGAQELATYFKSILSNKNHLNIYGCEFAKGKKGRTALKTLKELLDISISASDDITGKDGDWDLEVGKEFQLEGMRSYDHNLQGYVDSGTGIHRESIVWLQWNDPSLADGIHNGDSEIFTMPTGEQIQITFTNVVFTPAVPGSGNYLPADMRPFWASPGNERAFHPNYDFIGSSDNGMLYSGATGSGQNGQNITFDLNVVATRNGVPYVPDLIFVDPESTNPAATYQENITVTTNGGNWSLIENLQGTTYGLSGLGTTTATITDTESPQHAPLLLSKASTILSVSILYPHGNGHSGISFGILAPYDHSDAPASYGDAAHLQLFNASSGPNMVNNSTHYMGASVPDVEVTGISVDALGDDNTGDDEEAASFTVLSQGGLGTINVAVTGAGGFLQGWIDFDADGSFDLSDRIATNVQDGGLNDADGVVNGVVELQIIVPITANIGLTFARFRWSTTSNLDATTTAVDGEVEDYQIEILDSFGCETAFYQYYQDSATSEYVLARLDPATGSYVAVHNLGTTARINGWGYYDANELFYGAMVNSTVANRTLHVMDQTGNLIDLGAPLGLNIYAGDVDSNSGVYYGFAHADDTVVKVDLTTLQVSTVSVTTPSVQDMSFIPSENKFYGIVASTSNMLIFDPATNTFSQQALTGDITSAGGGAFGATWATSDGSLYVYKNPTGIIYQVNPSTFETVEVLNGTAGLNFNDGVSCPNAPPPFLDFGDAPDSYGTLTASNGPRHTIFGNLYFGSAVDNDSDGQENANANGDDSDVGGDDEDGITLSGTDLHDQTLFLGKQHTLQIITNGSGNISAWADWNTNGTFDAGEQIITDLASTGGTSNVAITVPANAQSGISYVRFRYTSSTGATPLGQLADGEVEDYRIQLKVATVITNRKITYRIDKN